MRKPRSFSLLLLGGCLMVLLLMLSPHVSASAAETSSFLRAENTGLPVTTSCPAPGKARAAVMPTTTFGTHPTIVYITNGVPNKGVLGTGTLLRYDVSTTQTTRIAQFAQTFLSSAQVSADGKWVLFDAETATTSKVQLIRLDGHSLQTLYCLAGGTSTGNGLSGLLWSPDQQHIVFAGPTNGTVTPIYLLNTQSGHLKLEASLDSGSANVAYILRTWLNNTQVYVSDLQFLGVPSTLYLLDISKSANQHLSDLTSVFQLQSGGTYGYFDFDKSVDTSKLFLTQTAFNMQTGPFAPSNISSQPAGGGSQATLYHSSTLVVENIRVISSASLLLRVESSTDTSQNGLWKINSDGTGLIRLTTEASGNEQSLGEMVQTPWSDGSRDGSRYVIANHNLQGTAPANSLFYGSLSGGSLTTFVSFTDGTNVNVAGWTRM